MPRKRNMPVAQAHHWEGEAQTPKSPGGIRVKYLAETNRWYVDIYVNKNWVTVATELHEHDADVVARELEAWRKE